MFAAALQSVRGFLTGKLFAHPKQAYGLLAAGIGVTGAILIAAVKVGLPLIAATALAGFVGGILQPRLYKDLKYG